MSVRESSDFEGGLILPAHKTLSALHPIATMPIPEVLRFPLLQRHGGDAPLRVAPGQRVVRGTVLAGGTHLLDPPIHASTSGRVRAIETHPLPHPAGGVGPTVVLEADGLDKAIEHEPWPDFRDRTAGELIERIARAGVTGLGGGGFPTAAKLSSGCAPIETLIVNGVECEPFISCDDRLMQERSLEILEGADIVRYLLGAREIRVAIERDKPKALTAMQRALEGAGLGGVEIVSVPVRYPMGSERILIRVLTGQELAVGSLPSDRGMLCLNVSTLAAIYRAVVKGEPLCSRVVTVTGQGVRQPQNLESRLGASLRDLIEASGGYVADVSEWVLGGSMSGWSVHSDQVPVVKTVNAVLAVGPGDLSEQADPQPCIRCGACSEVCPIRLLPQQLHWHARSGQLDRALDQGLLDCIECRCCDIVCPSHIPLVSQFRATRKRVVARQQERDRATQARLRFEARQSRLERQKRELAEMAERRKKQLGRTSTDQIREAIARARLKRAESRHPEGDPERVVKVD